jgi:four helix bundle protein
MENNQKNNSGNIILELTITFSLSVIRYCELLEQERKYVIANQLLKSATSVGANVFEAQHAESRADFIHKMKIAAKEAGETFYWLTLCEKAGYSFNPALKEALNTIEKIISKIISSAKSNIGK